MSNNTITASVNELVEARVLAEELKNDCTELQKLGITLRKAGMVAKPLGIAGGAVAWWWWGEPLLGLAVAAGGWIVENIVEDYRKTKFAETRLKWCNIFSSMGPRGMNIFLNELGQRHPHLVPAVDGLLAAS